MYLKPRTALVGGGKMGSALLRGWANAGCLEPAGSLLVIDPQMHDTVSALVKQHHGRVAMQVVPEQLTKLDTLVLAVKPQVFDEVATQLARFLPPDTLVISVVAGISLAQMENSFGAQPCVRAMPNTAAEIGKSVTAFCVNDAVNANALKRAKQLLAAIGSIEPLEDERLLDVVTAVSGSGPAYFFLLVEALAAAGRAEGLDEDMALKLAGETLIGTGALFEARNQSPSELRAEVTSAGGTTAAALDVLMGNGAFAEIMRNAISAATRRSGHLRNVR